MAYKNIVLSFLDYELSFGTSLVKVGQLGAEKHCVTHRHSRFMHINIRLCVFVQVCV